MNFFPPSIGLDISESSIKAVSLKKDGGVFDLTAFGKAYLPTGAVAEGELKNKESFLETLNTLLASEKSNFPRTKYLVVSLPEEKAFLRILELPLALKGEDLLNALKFEIEANMPVSLAEVYYDYEIMSENKGAGHYDIMINAIPKRIADDYTSFFNDNGWRLLALEMEALASQRALFPSRKYQDSVLVLDIGSTQTRFMIVSEGALKFTSSNTLAGNQFSQALSEHFPINLKEAEFMKRVVGLDKNHDKGREMLAVLRPNLLALKDQIQNYVNFFETHPASHQLSDSARKVSKVILVGGGAGLWGLTDWLSQELGLVVVLGDPLVSIKKDPHAKQKMSLEESLAYTSAVGLALRNFEEINI